MPNNSLHNIPNYHHSFDKLDADSSGKLEANELAPVALDMIGSIQDHGPPMTAEQCLAFILMVFDADGDSSIDRRCVSRVHNIRREA